MKPGTLHVGLLVLSAIVARNSVSEGGSTLARLRSRILKLTGPLLLRYSLDRQVRQRILKGILPMKRSESKERAYILEDPGAIRFYYYGSKTNEYNFLELDPADLSSLNSTDFDPSEPLKILIHGFKNNATGPPGSFPRDTKNAYLRHTNSNVICVDWGDLSTPKVESGASPDILYPLAVSNVPLVGEYVGKFLQHLLQDGHYKNPGNIHMIGFSLGAHVAGIAGLYIQEHLNGTKVGRITGLDPAAPMFERRSTRLRLDPEDANFVDVIHSSRLGMDITVGHVDIFPNGGRYQLNCLQQTREALLQLKTIARIISGSCDHSRAPLYYTKSISGKTLYLACKCRSWRDYLFQCKFSCPEPVPLGEFCPSNASGNYFLEITSV